MAKKNERLATVEEKIMRIEVDTKEIKIDIKKLLLESVTMKTKLSLWDRVMVMAMGAAAGFIARLFFDMVTKVSK